MNTLRATPVPAAAPAAPSAPAPATILVVDDRPLNRKYLSALLRYAGHHPLEASDGQEALALARAERPALIISDILMPVMNGYELVQQLRADPVLASTAVIFYSASYGPAEARRLADACQVSIVLPKPASPSEVLDAVARGLGQAVTPGLAAPPGARRETDPLRRFRDNLERHTAELRSASRALDELAGSPLHDPSRLREIAAVQADNIARVQRIGRRLCRILELGLDLAAERDIPRMATRLFEAACALSPSDIVVLGLEHPEVPGGRHALAQGVDTGWFTGAPPGTELPGMLRELMARGSARRVSPAEQLPPGELPLGHPAVGALLALPLASRYDVYGWLYFARPAGTLRCYTEEDEHAAAALAASATLFLENQTLYTAVQRQAAALQIEVGNRRQAETARAASEDRLESISRIQRMMSAINTLIVRTRSRPHLLEQACRVAVEAGGFGQAWIGSVTAAGGLRVVAHCGCDAGYLDALRPALDAGPLWDAGPGARLLAGGTPDVCQDLAAESRPTAWREAARQRGYRSAATLPLCVRGEVVACLDLCAREAAFFDEEELKLLSRLAGDLSYALEFIAREEQLEQLAFYDPLTRLANRRLFGERLVRALQEARAGSRALAVAVVDLEHFRAVNETLGAAGGDELLQQVAERLLRFAGRPDCVARIAGTQFALIVPEVAQAAELEKRLDGPDWLEVWRPYQCQGLELRLSARLGLALFPEDGTDFETLLHGAEAALTRAKAQGERYLFYTPQISAALREKLSLGTQLRRALEKDEFVLHYQPKLELTSGAICGAEALLRWTSPERGLVAPQQFIGLLEETGLIVEAGRWALQQAAADQRQWRAAGLAAPPIAVNVSALQLRQPEFEERLRTLVAPAQGAAPALQLEVTESLLMDDVEPTIARLERIREMGVSIAIDDFGTGYSSLAYLARLPVSAVKIDRSFVVRMTRSADTLSIVSAIVSLARSLNLRIIAEGVETEDQLRILRLLRCDEMQGFLFSPALPAAEFAQLLRSGRRLEQAMS